MRTEQTGDTMPFLARQNNLLQNNGYRESDLLTL